MLCQRPNQSMKVQFAFTKDALLVWNLIDFIAANLHFIREQEQKESPSCFYNCPCGTSTRSLCPSVPCSCPQWRLCEENLVFKEVKESFRIFDLVSLSRFLHWQSCSYPTSTSRGAALVLSTDTSCMSDFSAFR